MQMQARLTTGKREAQLPGAVATLAAVEAAGVVL
jgi:hypothetical protein